MSDWLLSYDISSDRARERMATLLGRHGYRVLYSTFALRLPDSRLDAVYEAAAGLLAGGDRLLALPTCPRCRTARHGRELEGPGTLVVGP